MSRALIARVWGPKGARLLAGDAIVVALLAAAAAGALFVRGGDAPAAGAAVYSGGRRVLVLDLEAPGVHEVRGPLGATRIQVRERRVRVLSSPCPLQVCRGRGWVGGAGEVLACVPNEVVVRLSGPAGAPDALSR